MKFHRKLWRNLVFSRSYLESRKVCFDRNRISSTLFTIIRVARFAKSTTRSGLSTSSVATLTPSYCVTRNINLIRGQKYDFFFNSTFLSHWSHEPLELHHLLVVHGFFFSLSKQSSNLSFFWPPTLKKKKKLML